MKSRIAHIRISNILGIEELEFDAGRFVQISGPNGSGKTSILEAIKATLKSGHDATLLRTGAEKGEAVIVLDDGTEITKRVREADSDTVVKDAAGKRQAKPASVVGALADLMSVNPVDFLRASKKERVSVLLESMPIALDFDRLDEIAGNSFSEYAVTKGRLEGSHALVTLDGIRKAIYDARTGTNRAVKEKHATINQLAATLPDADVEVPGGADGLVEKLQALDAAKDTELQRISTKLDGLRETKDMEVAELRRQIEEKEAKFREIAQMAATQRQITVEKHAADSASIRANLAAIQEAQKAASRHESTRDTIAQMRKQAEDLAAEAEAQTTALDELEAYKSDLLAALPIPGLTVVEGEIYRDGVPFDRLNNQQQVQIAVDIAKLRSGKLGVICCDNLELLDSAHLEEFKAQAVASGLQLFISRVADTEFNITNQE